MLASWMTQRDVAGFPAGILLIRPTGSLAIGIIATLLSASLLYVLGSNAIGLLACVLGVSTVRMTGR